MRIWFILSRRGFLCVSTNITRIAIVGMSVAMYVRLFSVSFGF